MIAEIKLILIAATLAFASYQDLKTREIDDKLWLITAPIGGVLTLYEMITTPGYQYYLAGFSIGLTVVLALGVAYIGLYGGADAKALIMISLTMPIYPFAGVLVSPFYPLTILGNGLVLSLLLIPTLAVLNLVWKVARKKNLFEGIRATPMQKLGALFTGIKVRPSTAMSVHFNLIEKFDGGKRYLKLFNRVEETDEVKIIDKKAEYVWVTPAIPMIVFFLFGFLLSLVGVDILIRVVTLLMQVF